MPTTHPIPVEAIEKFIPLTLELGLTALLTALLSLLLYSITPRLLARIRKDEYPRSHPWISHFLICMNPPVQWMVWLTGTTIILQILISQIGYEEIANQVVHIRSIALAWLCAWLLLRWREAMEQHYRDEVQPSLLDKASIGAIGRLIAIFVIFTASYTTLEILHVPLQPLLAVGGAGAVAAGLASRDIVANFFTGFVIYVTRPFAVGDWIKSPDKDVEGVVVQIGWYQTEIRNFERRPIYVPNSLFAQMVVVNSTRMTNRRIRENVGVRYSDIDKVPAIVKDIQSMLNEHPGVDKDLTHLVNFTSFGPYSLDMNIYCFTITKVFQEFRNTQEDILLKAAEIIDRHGAQIAFPTSVVKLEREETQELYPDTALAQS